MCCTTNFVLGYATHALTRQSLPWVFAGLLTCNVSRTSRTIYTASRTESLWPNIFASTFIWKPSSFSFPVSRAGELITKKSSARLERANEPRGTRITSLARAIARDARAPDCLAVKASIPFSGDFFLLTTPYYPFLYLRVSMKCML